MPMKLQPSSRSYDKRTQTSVVKHFYASTYSTASLVKMLGSVKTPKMRAKVRKELEKRKINLDF